MQPCAHHRDGALSFFCNCGENACSWLMHPEGPDPDYRTPNPSLPSVPTLSLCTHQLNLLLCSRPLPIVLFGHADPLEHISVKGRVGDAHVHSDRVETVTLDAIGLMNQRSL